MAIKHIILDRMARKVVNERNFGGIVTHEELERYAAMREPKLDLEHLSEETRMRIDNLGELLELRSRMQVDRLKGPELRVEYQHRA